MDVHKLGLSSVLFNQTQQNRFKHVKSVLKGCLKSLKGWEMELIYNQFTELNINKHCENTKLMKSYSRLKILKKTKFASFKLYFFLLLLLFCYIWRWRLHCCLLECSI